jgi:hypothetical protein
MASVTSGLHPCIARNNLLVGPATRHPSTPRRKSLCISDRHKPQKNRENSPSQTGEGIAVRSTRYNSIGTCLRRKWQARIYHHAPGAPPRQPWPLPVHVIYTHVWEGNEPPCGKLRGVSAWTECRPSAKYASGNRPLHVSNDKRRQGRASGWLLIRMSN